MTVSNEDQKVHMAMTADGNSRFRERDAPSGCSCASITRTRSTNLCQAASTGAARGRGSDGPTGQHDVINKQRERLHMAVTADGDSQDEAMSWLARARAARRR